MLRLWLTLLLSATLLSAAAQMWNGTDTLYGNEWIDYSQSYYRIDVAEEGLYRIPHAALQAAGLPVATLNDSQYQLWRMGEEVPLFVSAAGPLSPGGYIEFYGQPNGGELDQHLFEEPEERVNPWYSLVNDTIAYYLTWVEDGVATQRYSNVPNTLTDLPPADAWHWSERQLVFKEALVKREERFVYNNGNSVLALRRSVYQRDGFTDGYKKDQSFDLACPGLYAAGPPAQAEVRFLSNAAKSEHQLEVYWENTAALQDTAFFGSHFFRLESEWPAAALEDGLSVQIRGLNGNNDRYAVGGARVRYPRNFDMQGAAFAKMELPSGAGPRYLELTGLAGGAPAIVYDLGRQERLVAQLEGEVHRVRLNGQNGARPLAAAAQWQAVDALQPVAFTDPGAQPALDYLIVTHAALRQDDQGTDWVQAYADYRSSPAGGNYQVGVWDIAELYAQFGYGVERHPIAIRNFIHFLQQGPGNGLEYVLLIGKGREYQEVRKGEALLSALEQNYMLLPSFGYPASDNLLAAYPGQPVPTVPIGRVAAVSPEEVRIYLDKVQAFEANRDNPQTLDGRAWMKRIVHLGGGSNATEQSSIRNGLEGMKREAEGNRFGGQVQSFFKDAAEPLEVSLSEQIFSAINAGSSLLTFFGHSSPGTFDFNIDNPDNYNNAGKTPLMLSLGCYSGNIFTNGRGISERFVLLEDKAAIAFGASRGLGFISTLTGLGRSFYHYMGSSHYGQGIGDILQRALQDHAGNSFIGMQTLLEQFSLHGDPALRLHPAPGPDYTFDPASVSFAPRVVSAQLDSFELRFDVVNLGQQLADTFVLEIVHELPDGSRRPPLLDTITLPRSRTPFTYRLPVTGPAMVGENRFLLTLDPDNAIAEAPAAAEQNNELLQPNGTPGIGLFVVDNTARPVWPPRFAVVGADTVTLSASTTDALAPERTYRFELDTTPRFDSPQKQTTVVRQRGGVVQWQLPGPWQDSTAYFWRISPDSTETGVGYVWAESTFTWVEGGSGWMQGDGKQWLLGGEGDKVILDSTTGNFTFVDDFIDLRILNKVRQGDVLPNGFINNNRWSDFFRWEVPQSVNITVFNELGQIVWNELPGQYGSLNTTATKEIACFPFPVNTVEERLNIVNFLDTIVQPGYTVFFYTAIRNPNLDLNIDEWATDSIAHPDGKNIFAVVEEQGAQQVRKLEGMMRPYLFIYQKGVGPVAELIADDINGQVSYTHGVKGKWFTGSFSSDVIGPAAQWGEVGWEYRLEEPTDSLALLVYGLRPDGTSQLIDSTSNSPTIDLSNLDQREFPYIRLKYDAFDPNTTIPKVIRWGVNFEAGPELAMATHQSFDFYADTLQQGEPLYLRTLLSALNAEDSLRCEVEWAVLREGSQLVYSATDTLTLEEGQETELSFDLSTEDLLGDYQLLLQVKPSAEVPEHVLFNNVVSKYFTVLRDGSPPILQVTFDGRNIIDGELVAPDPEIRLFLKDENEFLIMEDTSVLQVSLSYPDGQEEVIAFDDERLTFEPASSSKNEAVAWFRPSFEQSGIYELSVSSQDITGNGKNLPEYRVKFEVETESMVTNVLNYPNPFSTSTQFVYTLTGRSIPSEFVIRIMTISGKVVKDIPLHLLEPLQYGTHTTSYRWDGTDEYGDPLANGVYLYQTIVRGPNGEALDKRESSYDHMFKNGFGKLVILR